MNRLEIQAIVLFMILAAAPASAQTPYPGIPDWVSSDTQVSTGAALVDLDRDGLLDLVVSNGNDIFQQRLAVYTNQGDGTFPPVPDWQSGDLAYNGHLDTADVNGDGWPDVAVTHLLESPGAESAAKLYLNQNGVLSSWPDWTSREKARAFGIAFGDVNNDGRPDLAVATGWAYSPAKLFRNYVYLNVGGQLESQAGWASDDLNTDQGALWVDADRDGWLDAAFTGAGDDTRIYRNLGGTLETVASWRTADNPDQDAIMMDAGDVNQDGYAELFVTDNQQLSGGGYFRGYPGLPAGYFSATPGWSYFDGYGSALALADVDGDGDLDLATGAWWDHARLFFNQGSGLAAAPGWSSAGTSVVEKIVFGDVNPSPGTTKQVINRFAPEGPRRLFHLSRRQIQQVEKVVLDGAELEPWRFTFSRERGWITVHAAPAVSLEVVFDYSISLDMAIANWDSDIGNQLYYNRTLPAWLEASADTLSVSTGGAIDLALAAGPENGNRTYLLLGSMSGQSPGLPLPGGIEVLPLNWDSFTDFVLGKLNTALFQGFLGMLGPNGSAAAKIQAPPLSSSKIGKTMHLAYLLEGAPWNFASNAAAIGFTP